MTNPSSGITPHGSSRVPGELVVEAPAKVNVYLDIIGRRPDGYHQIDTVMLAVALCDRLHLSSRTDGRITLSVEGLAADVPADEHNLAHRAAASLAPKARGRGVDMRLVKRIPAGAGLGGGSSDAAATLVGLRELWSLDVPDEALHERASHLGSDVPFFLGGGAARCAGRGERVEPLVVRGTAGLVLVFSPPLSTAAVYAEYDRLQTEGSTTAKPSDMLPLRENGVLDLSTLGRVPLWNALEPAAFRLDAGLAAVRDAVRDAGARAAGISGSGSCIFGVAASDAEAERIARGLTEAGYDALAVRCARARRADRVAGDAERV